MKNVKILFLLVIVAVLNGCSSNGDDTPAFPLSNANIAGSYNISNLNVSTDITTTSNNIPIKVATASTQGDLFKVDVEMFANGTYTMKGSYTIVYKLTPVVGTPVETRDIINIDNSGNFTLNTVNNTITFSGAVIQGLSGTLDFEVFNASGFSLFQEIDVDVNNNVENITTNISFTRK